MAGRPPLPDDVPMNTTNPATTTAPKLRTWDAYVTDPKCVTRLLHVGTVQAADVFTATDLAAARTGIAYAKLTLLYRT